MLRSYAKLFRKALGITADGPFPVLEVLDKLDDIFPGCCYIIVEDGELPPQTMACCTPNSANGFTIKIKESVYNGAYSNHIGAFRGFICHEIAHVFLFKIGFNAVFAQGW